MLKDSEYTFLADAISESNIYDYGTRSIDGVTINTANMQVMIVAVARLRLSEQGKYIKQVPHGGKPWALTYENGTVLCWAHTSDEAVFLGMKDHGSKM